MKKNIKVAKIISTKQIVINAGKKNGIKVGDELEIVGQIGDPVKDPDTGEVLGTLDNLKGRVTVTTVYENMAIADAPTKDILDDPYTQSQRLTAKLARMSDPLQPFKKTIQEDLNVDPEEITGGLPEGENEYDNQIHVGDTVILSHKAE